MPAQLRTKDGTVVIEQMPDTPAKGQRVRRREDGTWWKTSSEAPTKEWVEFPGIGGKYMDVVIVESASGADERSGGRPPAVKG